MLNLFWEYNQHREIDKANDSARSASRQARSAADKATELEMQVDKLTLTCAALWSLLQRSGYTNQDLENAIREADMTDGTLDGRIHVPVSNCKACGRTVSRRHGRCLYCGDSSSNSADPFAGI